MDVAQRARQVLQLASLTEGGHFDQLATAFDRLCRAADCRSPEQLLELLEKELDRCIREEDGIVQPRKVRRLLDAILGTAFNRILVLDDPDGPLPDDAEQLLVSPFVLARAFCAALSQYRERDSDAELADVVVRELRCFRGYSPRSILHRAAHEEQKAAPQQRRLIVPLWVAGVGVAYTKYELLIRQLLELLEQTPEELLLEASIDLKQLDEIALELDEYDFLHPAYHRPGHVMGEYDPEYLNDLGNHRRFVFRKWLLDELLSWTFASDGLRDCSSASEQLELLHYRTYAAATVLGGTMMIAAGASGIRPDGHGSRSILSEVVRNLPYARDGFYQHHFRNCPKHLARWAEADRRRYRQPFAGVRQHVNRALMRRVAAQHLNQDAMHAALDAGLATAARTFWQRQTSRFGRCIGEVACLVGEARRALEQGKLDTAARLVRQAGACLREGVRNRTLGTPKDYIAFSGQFPLGPAPQDAVVDSRLGRLTFEYRDVLYALTEVAISAVLAGKAPLAQSILKTLRSLSDWWMSEGGSFPDEVRSYGQRAAALEAAWLQRFAAESNLEDDPLSWLRLAVELGPVTRAIVVGQLIKRGYLRTAAEVILYAAAEAPVLTGAVPVATPAELALNWVRTVISRWQQEREKIRQRATLDQVVWYRLAAFVNALELLPQCYRKLPDGFSVEEWLDYYRRDWGQDVPQWPPRGWTLQEYFANKRNDDWQTVDEQFFGPSLPVVPVDADPASRARRHQLVTEYRNLAEQTIDDEPYKEDVLDTWHDLLRLGLEENVDASVDKEWGEGKETDEDLLADINATFEAVVNDQFDAFVSNVMTFTAYIGHHADYLSSLSHIWHAIAVHGPKLAGADRREQDEQIADWITLATDYYRQLVDFLELLLSFDLPGQPSLTALRRYYERMLAILHRCLSDVAHAALYMVRAAETLSALVPDDLASSFTEEAPRWAMAAIDLRRALLAGARKDLKWRAETLVETILAQREGIDPTGRRTSSGARGEAQIQPRWIVASLAELAASLVYAGAPDVAMEIVVGVVGGSSGRDVGLGQPLPLAQDSEIPLSTYEAIARVLAPALAKAARQLDNGSARSNGAREVLSLWRDLRAYLGTLYSYLCPAPAPAEAMALLEEDIWKAVVEFIKEFGGDLFTQDFMQRGNLLRLLDIGLDAYLKELAESRHGTERPALVDYYMSASREEQLRLRRLVRVIVGCIASEYDTYLEYNSSTVYSDYGNFLYVLLDFLRLVARAKRLYVAAQLNSALFRGLAAHDIKVARRIMAEDVLVGDVIETFCAELHELERKYGIVLGSVRDLINNVFRHCVDHAFLQTAVEMLVSHDDKYKVPESEWVQVLTTAMDRSIENGNPQPAWMDELSRSTATVATTPGWLWAHELRRSFVTPKWQAGVKDLRRLCDQLDEMALGIIGVVSAQDLLAGNY